MPAVIIFMALALMVTRARAEPETKEQRIPCWVVKAAVTTHGEEGAVQQARARGASERQIAEARRCIKATYK